MTGQLEKFADILKYRALLLSSVFDALSDICSFTVYTLLYKIKFSTIHLFEDEAFDNFLFIRIK